ncbi:MerR family transcriptional regulator [Bacillus sp. MUM 13]|uniref:MerR family transcriptional regulator n=1 Tax=Bacillus sp. MUM 13 TaxID=1678001 RepID=UPI0008F5698E|nr:MerR family transcriptional regulator [Bacillus sp. MUM 13]OIK13539.1 MerR family transcriptional regulator [Bacillus sp. MUM 13]
MTYSIKEITEKTGLSASTLRYYEKEGILPFVKRDENGKRLYSDENIEWIHFILALLSTGMPIAEIKRYVELYKNGDTTIKERRQIMIQHKTKVEEEMMKTYTYLEQINYKLALYDVIEANLKNKEIKI